MRAFLLLSLALGGCFGGDDDTRFVVDTTEERTFVGTVSVEPQSLEIRATPGGSFVVGTVTITNVGEFPLELTSAKLIDGNTDELVTDEDTNGGRTLGPDRSYEALITCTLPADTDLPDTDAPGVSAVFRVRTNDEATPEVDVPVSCVPDA